MDKPPARLPQIPGLTLASPQGFGFLSPTSCNRGAGWGSVEYSIWISRPHWANLSTLQSVFACDLMPFIQNSVRLRRAFAILMALASLAAVPALAEGFKFGQPDESDRIEKEARE